MGSHRQLGVYIGKTTQPADVLNLAPSLAQLCHATACDQALLLGTDASAREAAMALALDWGAMRRRRAGQIIRVGDDAPGDALAFGDLPALHAAVDSQTVAIMLQPTTGPGADAYLNGVEQLCRALDILLIIDDLSAPVAQPDEVAAPPLFQRLGLAFARARSHRLH